MSTKQELFTVNTRTINGNIVVSTVHPSTLTEVLAELDKRVPGMRKSCFVNVSPEMAKQLAPVVEKVGRVLIPTKGSGFLLGLPKREELTRDEILSAFGAEMS